MKLKLILLFCASLTNTYLMAQSAYQWKSSTTGEYKYKYVTNDPTKSRFYTLENGLTVVLSSNDKEPKIDFRVAVRAGSNTDPKTATGLAHYLEHLLFKGTDKFGTLNFQKEKPLLDKIDLLYEEHNKITDPTKRKEIYAQIDKTSREASNYAIANEYDKIMKSLGSQTTNAHTSYEETVYKEDFPANSAERFLNVQAERFRNPIFRIFHTELEAVYEEKNRGLDNDGWKMSEQISSVLFPTHNYGQQTTIGTISHLKNPSLLEIRKYYNTYYVPNNMIIAMAGDFNPDEMIAKVDKAFAYMKPKPIPAYNPAPEKPLTEVQQINIYGPSAESVRINYRGYAENSKESLMLELISSILSNDKAGLIDINLNQQQKVIAAGAGYQQMKDYGIFMLSGRPKHGQSLPQVQELLLEQIALLKNGEFDEGLIKAIVVNNKFALLQAFDSNAFRVDAITNEFILNQGKNWNLSLASQESMGKITKQEVIDFAKKFFLNNYVVAYKNKGEDKNMAKVEKPLITPINTNSGYTSPFAKALIEAKISPIQPKFIDYQKDLSFSTAGIANVITVQNKQDNIFRLSYRFEFGSWNNQLYPFAAQYLDYLGTDKFSSQQIGKQFYNIACDYRFNVANESATITISGLQENFNQAVSLVAHIFANCKPDEQALAQMKQTIFKNRENAKLNKANILNGLASYAQYGAENPFNYTLSDEQINAMTSKDLISILHSLNNYPHSITYYGPQTIEEFTSAIKKVHVLPKSFTEPAAAKKFSYSISNSTKVYFADYDMVQAEVRWIRNAGKYNGEEASKISLFNSYFGGGMGSIVFQTIRESKALAYSTYAVYSSPDSQNKQFAMNAYVGSQADKLKDAISGMNELLNELPESKDSFIASKVNAVNVIQTTRIGKDGIIQKYFADKKMGFDHDSMSDLYTGLVPLTFADIKSFHEQRISSKAYNYCIVASAAKVNMGELQKIGPVTTLDLRQIFGY